MDAVTRLSVVMPAFNEADSIEQLVLDLERDVVALHRDVEVIVVDDCSTDETLALLLALARERSWLRVVAAERNAGHGPSVVRAVDLAGGEWIFQLDSDRQFVVSEFSRLWARRGEADLVLGVRVRRTDPLHRLVLSRAVRVAVSILTGRRLSDCNVPFRLFRSDVWADLRPLIPTEALAPSILTAVGAAVRGWRVAEVPVSHLPRPAGTASLRRIRLLRFSLRGLVELAAFRLALARAHARTDEPAVMPFENH